MKGGDASSALFFFRLEHETFLLFMLELVIVLLEMPDWLERYGLVLPPMIVAKLMMIALFSSWLLLTFSIVRAVPVMRRDHPMFLPGAYFAVSPHGYTPAMNLAVLPPYALPCIVLPQLLLGHPGCPAAVSRFRVLRLRVMLSHCCV